MATERPRKYARREIFFDEGVSVTIKLRPNDVAKIDKLAAKMNSQRAGAVRAVIYKGITALRLRT
jgi:predicted transcriptional regulator